MKARNNEIPGYFEGKEKFEQILLKFNLSALSNLRKGNQNNLLDP